MTNLVAIVRATRASAKAVERMQRCARLISSARWISDRSDAERAYRLAERAYARAQAVLKANPLPGDK